MWNWGLLFVITFLASLLSAPMPAWLMFAALLGLFAAPGRGAHFLTAANDAPADTPPDLRALSEREMKDVLTRLTRRERAA